MKKILVAEDEQNIREFVVINLERLLPHHTGYITDAGMTGVADSVLGVKPEIIIGKLRTKMPAQEHLGAHGIPRHFQKGPHGRPHQDVHLPQADPNALQQGRSDIGHRLAGQFAVEHPEEHPQDIVGQIEVTVKHPVLHGAGGAHQDEHGRAPAGLDKLHCLYPGGVPAGGGGDSHAPGHPRKQPGGPAQQFLWIVRAGEKHGVKSAPLFFLQLGNLHQVVHIFPIPFLRGDPPGRGVWLL